MVVILETTMEDIVEISSPMVDSVEVSVPIQDIQYTNAAVFGQIVFGQSMFGYTITSGSASFNSQMVDMVEMGSKMDDSVVMLSLMED